METAEVLTKTKWSIDRAHSEISFKVKHLMITNVRGVFTDFEVNIYTTNEDFLTSEIDVWINPTSVNTGDIKRDEHLQGVDFFDVANHKQINFVGNTFEKPETDDYYHLFGDLTIKGITKQIKLNVEFCGVMKDPWGNDKAGFSISGKINRNDWDLNWNTALELGGVLVSEDVRISGEIQLVKQVIV